MHEQVHNIIKDNVTSYDVLLTEFIDHKAYAFAAKFKCPHIGVASLSIMSVTHEVVGNPVHPILHPDMLTPYYSKEMGFFDKVDAVLFYLYQRYYYHHIFMPSINSVVNTYFGTEIPDLWQLEKNVSMLFQYTSYISWR